MKPLFITAHYDDLEVCAGGTASRYGGTSIVLLPRPTHGTFAEAEAAATILGLSSEYAYRGDRLLVADIGKYVADHTHIIAASPYDSHPEHRKAADIARQLARKNNVNLWYMDHAIPGGYSAAAPRPNHFVYFDTRQKYEAIGCYSVMEQHVIDTIETRDYYYGSLAGANRTAEGFIIARSSQ